MKRTLLMSGLLMTGFVVASVCYAQGPAGSTGECKDGTYTSAPSKRGACAGHGGVKDWYESGKSTQSSSKSSAASSAAAAPSTTSPATESKSSSKATQSGMRSEAAPGGGGGRVWVNTASNVYHCTGDEWYGKTKKGEYMTESEAKAKGAHASHGKACS